MRGKAFSHQNRKKKKNKNKKSQTNSQKYDKQCVENYKPVFLLPISSKVFERIGYNTMFPHFTENNLTFENQSEFKSGDSCVNQLLTITDEIFFSFDVFVCLFV